MPSTEPFQRRLRQGSILWARIKGSDGRPTRKAHAVVITTPDRDIPNTQLLAGVGVTSTPHRATDPQLLVELPWHPNGHPRTGFRKKCYAVCDWQAVIDVHDAGPVRGQVPAANLQAIIEKRNALR